MADKYAGGIRAASTSVSIAVLLRKTADNTEHTGAAHSDVTASYQRQGAGRTAITMADLSSAAAAYAEGGWEEIDSTNMPGLYRFDIPDAAFAVGADFVVIAVKVASCYVFYERYALEYDVPRGDEIIDKTTTPWEQVVRVKGTQTEITRKKLRTVDSVNITSEEQVLARRTET